MPPTHASLTFADCIPPAPTAWLWPNRIPYAQLTLLVGEPGVGKSLLAAELAARITTGQPWPDPASSPPSLCRSVASSLPLDPSPEPAATDPSSLRRFVASSLSPWSPNPHFAHQPASPDAPFHEGAVIIVSPEDHPAEILLPRLEAAGANLARVAVLHGVSSPANPLAGVAPLVLPDNLTALEGAVCATPNARLLVLDPLHALLSTASQCCPAILTRLLITLASYARRFNIAVLATVHLAKSTRARTLYRVRGSIGLTAAARAAHLLTADPNAPDRRILAPLKTVYGVPPSPLAFRIAPNSPRGASAPCGQRSDQPTPAPRLVWDQAPAQLPADLLDIATEQASALSEACDWLLDFLQAVPRPAPEVLSAAAKSGIPRTTLFRAKHALNIRSVKQGPGQWLWTPPGGEGLGKG